jgi:hypothetical protein
MTVPGVRAIRRTPAYRLLPANYRRVFNYVAARESADQGFFAAVSTTAKALKISERTVTRAFGRLVQEGLLLQEDRYRENGQQTTNRYRSVTPPELAGRHPQLSPQEPYGIPEGIPTVIGPLVVAEQSSADTVDPASSLVAYSATPSDRIPPETARREQVSVCDNPHGPLYTVWCRCGKGFAGQSEDDALDGYSVHAPVCGEHPTWAPLRRPPSSSSLVPATAPR